ncbi:hypothetical protein Agub_g7001 [Astrephomene gubernaculifera]|uniref:Ankyrin repeat domain-containing protein n=1 Tax=Astrephomene gubernaculifera TaxID=47775 RepID=A0AAD3HLD5_9CHLO|nr:hypothetical protein Agub_g7001 [Astrephomene gubernaculifera]
MEVEKPSSRIWPRLPPELAEHVVKFLPSHEIACTVRLVNKAAAAQFRGTQHVIVRLSKPVPFHALAWYLNRPGAMHRLTFSEKRRLLCLIACSGDPRNLALAASYTQCVVGAEVLESAAAAGQLAVCHSLRSAGCPWGSALASAAEAGQLEACRWLLANGCPWSKAAVHAAARKGHRAIAAWLQQQRPEGSRPTTLEATVAAMLHGCSLQVFLEERAVREGRVAAALSDASVARLVLGAAAGSPTADWRAKIAWLEGLGVPKSSDACREAAACPDALDRLHWLRQRRYAAAADAAAVAAKLGRTDVLEYLLGEGVVPDVWAARWAAEGGHVAVLTLLQSCGCPVRDSMVLYAAARTGQMAALQWLLPGDESGSAYLFYCAAQSGSVELLAWLRDRGCPRDATAFQGAAQAGCEEALEWLVEQGCPMQVDGTAYLAAARNVDMATLRYLRRLGCPWGPPGWLFTSCVQERCCLHVLFWLLLEGCPVDWEAAVAAARRLVQAGGGEVHAWLVEQQRQQRLRRQQQRRRVVGQVGLLAVGAVYAGLAVCTMWKARQGCEGLRV